MSDEVVFSEPIGLPENLVAFIPHNYLPAALSAITEDPDARSRLLLLLPIPGAERVGPRYARIDAKTLSNPQATAEFIGALDGIQVRPGEVKIFLGPEVSDQSARQEPVINTLNEIVSAPVQAEDMEGFDVAVVVIDAGIAFWNRRFRGPAGPRFREVRFLDFELDDWGLGTANLLNASQIADFCNLADTEGSSRVMADLGKKFPGSFYGKTGTCEVDGIWHGTAVADLAAGSDPGQTGTMDRVGLFGLELPATLLREADGDALTAVLAILVDQAIQITRSFGTKNLVIVLPFGFAGGPQDGTHPAARAINDTLALGAACVGKVTFMVPAGNHLQDRCRARLPAAQPVVPLLSVDWQIAPDDFSSNQIEILIDNVDPSDERASLQVVPPGPAPVQTTGLKAGQVQIITVGSATAGMLMRHANVAMPAPLGNLRARLRLCLAPTGCKPGGPVAAPFGCWRLSTHSVEPVDLWVLRDDRDSVGDGAFPRRPSWLDDPLYHDVDHKGAPGLYDDPGSMVLRSGTLSVLATAPSVVAVQADEQFGTGPSTKASSSGSPDMTAVGLTATLNQTGQLVDDGRMVLGVMAAANGTERLVRFSGTSAAVGLAAREEALSP